MELIRLEQTQFNRIMKKLGDLTEAVNTLNSTIKEFSTDSEVSFSKLTDSIGFLNQSIENSIDFMDVPDDIKELLSNEEYSEEDNGLNKYILFWEDDKQTVVEGTDINDAVAKAGITEADTYNIRYYRQVIKDKKEDDEE